MLHRLRILSSEKEVDMYGWSYVITNPDDQLIFEFADNFTYWQLAKNKEFVARVKQRLIERDEIHKRRKVIS